MWGEGKQEAAVLPMAGQSVIMRSWLPRVPKCSNHTESFALLQGPFWRVCGLQRDQDAGVEEGEGKVLQKGTGISPTQDKLWAGSGAISPGGFFTWVSGLRFGGRSGKQKGENRFEGGGNISLSSTP